MICAPDEVSQQDVVVDVEQTKVAEANGVLEGEE